jgi:AcrR family transcriptional regulator
MNAKENREQIIRDTKSGLILDAASKIFAEKGFHETKLEEIAVMAGFSKATLYNYYTDKESIFINLAEREFEKLFKDVVNNSDPQAKFINILEKNIKTMLYFFGEHFAFMLTTSDFRKNITQLSAECHEKRHEFFMRVFLKLIDSLADMVSLARKHGEFSCEIEDKVIAEYIATLVKDVVFKWKTRGKDVNIDSEIRNIMAFISHGLNIK